MFRPTRPSSGALKFAGTAVSSALLRLVCSYLQCFYMKYPEKDNTCGIEGGTALTSCRNAAVARKTQQFLRISTHLMMAE
jgi:hypothetical protein